MYVLGLGDEETPLELTRVDAVDHSVAWRVPVPGQWSQTVFAAGGSVWVLGTDPDARGPVEVTMLYRLDPTTGQVVDQVPLTSSATFIPVVQGDTVWFRGEDGALRFDPVSGAFVGDPVQPAPGCCTGAFVSDGEGGVWVLSSPGAGVERSIWHIDASGTVVASGNFDDPQAFEESGGQSYAFDPVTQTIWIHRYRDSVSRVELVSNEGS